MNKTWVGWNFYRTSTHSIPGKLREAANQTPETWMVSLCKWESAATHIFFLSFVGFLLVYFKRLMGRWNWNRSAVALLMHLNFVPQVSRMISLGEREMISQKMGDYQNRDEQFCWPGYAKADWAKDCSLMHPFHWLALSIWLAMFTVADAFLFLSLNGHHHHHHVSIFCNMKLGPYFSSTSIESGSKHRTGSWGGRKRRRRRTWRDRLWFKRNEEREEGGKKQGKNCFVHFWPCPLLASACSFSQGSLSQELWVQKKKKSKWQLQWNAWNSAWFFPYVMHVF